MTWVPLHVHSQYSILDASAPISRIVDKSAEFGIPAMALTDHGNMFGAVEFWKACRHKDIKPIIGCEVYVAAGSHLEKKRIAGVKDSFHLVLLAKNKEGYRNLCKLTSIAYLDGFYYRPRIDRELLKKYSKGLVCLSACISGSVPNYAINGSREECFKDVEWFKNLFGEDYYIELQRHAMADEDIIRDGIDQESWLHNEYRSFVEKQEKANSVLIEASKALDVKCVVTNDSHYIERKDWKAHEILLNVQSGEPCEIWEKDAAGNNKTRILNPRRRVYSSHEFYFKTPEQMECLFPEAPDAAENTVEVSDKCSVELDFETKHYPVFIPPTQEDKNLSDEDRIKEAEKYLYDMCLEGIPKRYTSERLAKVKEKYLDRDPMDVITERLKYEMSILGPKGLCDYLLIVCDFIRWAKSEGIPMGPGRGSGAGSIVCYLIDITDIEPLRFNLLFERFINPERMSYPDIDVDICMERRGEVIEYMVRKYGINNIAQIVTFGSMKAKMAIKDVGRVLSVPLVKVNKIAKLIPEELNITIDRAMEIDSDLRSMYAEDSETKQVIDMGRALEGSIRNTGVHAAGLIVCGDPLVEHIPLCRAKDSNIALTQFSMKPVESVGMLKVDFLGLKTLTSIKKAVDSIRVNTGKEIDWVNLPLDDHNTFELLNKGDTLGVFQVESGGMQDLARQLHLDKFEELIAVISLYRPGPMDMIPSFINRKHGREPIEYDHPWVEDILSETYGIMVYQEQVMQIASKLANFSLGEGDVLRRAMGKKDMAQMAQQRVKFCEGALVNDIDKATSGKIFDKMEKFAAYGFNKSHAAAYALLSYVTAYLKANYPTEWISSLMSCDRDDIEKVSKFIREAQSMNIPILSPDVNESGKEFVPTSHGVRFAMTAIRGVGVGVVESIVEERERSGPFKNLYDFVKRIDSKKVGKKVVENLIGAGCFDFAGWSRDAMRESVEPMYDAAIRERNETSLGVMSLFSLMDDHDGDNFSSPPKVSIKSTRLQTLMKERELLGFFLTGHPMEEYSSVMERLSCVSLSHVDDMDIGGIFRTLCIVDAVQVKISAKTQRKFAILMVSDGLERMELPIWPELYEEKGHLLKDNQLLYAILQVQERDGKKQLNCKWLDDLTIVSEDMIQQCDQAYDKAKFTAMRMSRNRVEKKKTVSKKVMEKVADNITRIPSVSITVDIDIAELSGILRLKDLISAHYGASPVSVDFRTRDDREVARVSVGEQYRVKIDEQFKDSIKKIPMVVSYDEK